MACRLVKETHIRFALVALIPALAFWGLDAFYLRHGRLFRQLYTLNRSRRVIEVDIAGAEKKIRQAEFFLWHLENASKEYRHEVGNTEPMEFYFSACLSAAQS